MSQPLRMVIISNYSHFSFSPDVATWRSFLTEANKFYLEFDSISNCKSYPPSLLVECGVVSEWLISDPIIRSLLDCHLNLGAFLKTKKVKQTIQKQLLISLRTLIVLLRTQFVWCLNSKDLSQTSGHIFRMVN